jgi:hypothetical protein
MIASTLWHGMYSVRNAPVYYYSRRRNHSGLEHYVSKTLALILWNGVYEGKGLGNMVLMAAMKHSVKASVSNFHYSLVTDNDGGVAHRVAVSSY